MLDARGPRPADWLWLGVITGHGATARFLLILGISAATALSGRFRESFLAMLGTGMAYNQQAHGLLAVTVGGPVSGVPELRFLNVLHPTVHATSGEASVDALLLFPAGGLFGAAPEAAAAAVVRL